jgi:predicted nucleic-acid-binding Zn-ribbon protein
MTKVMESIAKCPKCGSKDLFIDEIYETGLQFDQTDGNIDMNGNIEQGGILRMNGECKKCGHSWRFRKLQVTDLQKFSKISKEETDIIKLKKLIAK